MTGSILNEPWYIQLPLTLVIVACIGFGITNLIFIVFSLRHRDLFEKPSLGWDESNQRLEEKP